MSELREEPWPINRRRMVLANKLKIKDKFVLIIKIDF